MGAGKISLFFRSGQQKFAPRPTPKTSWSIILEVKFLAGHPLHKRKIENKNGVACKYNMTEGASGGVKGGQNHSLDPPPTDPKKHENMDERR